MDKTTLLAELKKQRLVAVIRGKDEEEVTNIVDAVYRGGIHFMEITYTIPQAEQVIAHLCKAYEHCDDIIIGAGTCLDIVSARMAISAGAQFVPCFPGAANVKDMLECLRYGADVIKLFPGDTFGPKAVRAFKGPLPQADFMPTGGVSAANLTEWLDNGAVAVGTGGSLTKGAKAGDFEAVRLEAEKLVNIVRAYDQR